MGLVDIPADPKGSGRFSVHLELSGSELTVTIERLRDALKKLQHQRR